MLQKVHARHLDRKNLIFENLDQGLVESEAQFATALQSHLISIDTLIDLQNSRLDTLKSQFQGDVDMLDAEFSGEKYLCLT